MTVRYTNNASSKLSASITNTQTSMAVLSGEGSEFPSLGASEWFYATLVGANGTEIVKVTGRASDTFTIVRGQDGTSGLAFAANDTVELRITKAMLDDLKTDAVAGIISMPSGTGYGGSVMVNLSGNAIWSDANFTYDPIMGNFRALGLRASMGASAPTWNFNNILHAGNYTAYVRRIVAISDGTSITMNADTTDMATQNNTQSAGTLTINAPSGSPVDGQKIMLRLTTTNVQALAFDSAFLGSTDLALPSASSGSNKEDYMGFVYDNSSSKWHLIAKNFGF